MEHKIITPDNIDDWFMTRLKIVKELNAKNNIGKHDKQNIMIEILQKQIDFRNREHEDFAQRIKICDLEIEILKDYEYGLIERIQLPEN